MPDNYTDDDDFDIEESDGSDIKGLRRAASKGKRLEQELNQLKRELAFARAGIQMDDPKMGYFVKGYDGELSADSIRQAALEAGFLAAAASDQQAQQTQQFAAAQQNVMSAAAGASNEDMSEEAVLFRMQQAMEEGGVTAMLDVARQYGIPIGSEM